LVVEEEEAAAAAASAALSSAPQGLFALSALTSLSLVSLPAAVVSDALLAPLLQALGARLTSVRLERLPGVTDASLAALAEHVVPHGALRKLALVGLDKVTDGGLDCMAQAFQALGRGGAAAPRALQCLALGTLRRVTRSDVLLAFLLGVSGGFGGGASAAASSSPASAPASSGSALQHVSLAHLPALSGACLVALGRACGRSLLTLNVSMCRGFGDEALGALVNACPRLRHVQIWGCTQLTGVFYLGHARASWRGEGAGAKAPQPCATHPDLPWAVLEVVGRPGHPLPAPAEGMEAFFFP